MPSVAVPDSPYFRGNDSARPFSPVLRSALFPSQFLTFVIRNVPTGAKEKGMITGIAVGSVIVFAALFAGPISGASMNPARSFAPAVVSLNFDHLRLYLLATSLGATVSVVA